MAKRTMEEKREWRSKMGAMASKIRQMDERERDEMWERIGTITCEGRRLSPFNTVFLAQQAESEPVQVGGFRQWQKVGRCVKKGERSCGVIWVPIGKRKGEDGSETGSNRFRLVPMFDVRQTEAVKGERCEPRICPGCDAGDPTSVVAFGECDCGVTP